MVVVGELPGESGTEAYGDGLNSVVFQWTEPGSALGLRDRKGMDGELKGSDSEGNKIPAEGAPCLKIYHDQKK